MRKTRIRIVISAKRSEIAKTEEYFVQNLHKRTKGAAKLGSTFFTFVWQAAKVRFLAGNEF